MGFPFRIRALAPLIAAAALAGCTDGFDFDLRDGLGGFDTSNAVQTATQPRPEPDSRGVISYPTYQVAVARAGDTVSSVADRVGLDAQELAGFNGLKVGVNLRAGEIIALPQRVANPSAATGAVDIADIAGGAIERAPEDAIRPASVSTTTLPPAAVQPGPEPVRHKVQRGETAFTIARLYDVPLKSLAEWNSLNADLDIREGQFLLIPVTNGVRPTAVTAPGAGSATPTPPSSTQPVPSTDATPAAQATPAIPTPDIGTQTASTDTAEFLPPVQAPVIRAYAAGRNEGVDFGAPAGASVKAAADGTVAAVTRDTNNVAIVVIKHDGNLLTVYTQVDGLKVARGDRVRRGQEIAKVRAGDPSFLHFEVRNGLESVDPANYIGL